jgi:GDPmannose 4,6-dehydratase
LLLEKGYEVFGLINGQNNDKLPKLKSAFPDIKVVMGDLTDYSSIFSAIQLVRPHEIYNLGAISHVGLSFSQPELTANVTGLGILRILESCRALGLTDSTRIYQASSSEMFGKVRETPQNENTPFYPRSPYGVAKTFAHYTSVNYREAYGLHVSSGILFNHEGEFRGTEFVTRKISLNVARIKLGLIGQFKLGSLEPKRDWGYAGDYVDAMWRMLQLEKPEDFVISTGETHSVREFLELAFSAAGLDEEISTFVTHDPDLIRPSEVDLLVGDSAKAKRILGWEPKTLFSDLVYLMVRNDLVREASRNNLQIPNTPSTQV